MTTKKDRLETLIKMIKETEDTKKLKELIIRNFVVNQGLSLKWFKAEYVKPLLYLNVLTTKEKERVKKALRMRF